MRSTTDTCGEVHRIVGVFVHREALVGHKGLTHIVHLEEEACALQAEVRIGDEQRSLSADIAFRLEGELLVGGHIVGRVIGGVPIALDA